MNMLFKYAGRTRFEFLVDNDCPKDSPDHWSRVRVIEAHTRYFGDHRDQGSATSRIIPVTSSDIPVVVHYTTLGEMQNIVRDRRGIQPGYGFGKAGHRQL